MKGILIRLALFGVFIITVFSWYIIPDRFFVRYSEASDVVVNDRDQKKIEEQREKEKEQKKKALAKKEEKKMELIESKQRVKQSVPFVVQAPHAQWDDPLYQDACEEASMLMAAAWVHGERYISKNDAEDKMEEIFQKEKEIVGASIDTSAFDTAEIYKKHFGFDAEVRNSITMEEMYEHLENGAIIIAPTNGKKLANPNYSNGGPERHMLVIIGFDRKTGDFITNDPGTRVGKGYKYKDAALYNSIRDYETGDKKPIEGNKKNVIIVKK